MQPETDVSPVARLQGVSESLLLKWRELTSQCAPAAVKADDDVAPASRAGDLA